MARQQVTIVTGTGPDRQPIFSVLVKRSYAIRDGAPLIEQEEAEPFLRGDLYHDPGDPERCSLRREEECVPYKLATDVVLLAEAHAPDGRPAETVTVGVEIGGHRKLLRVTGDRFAHHRPGRDPGFTDPEPFMTMPIRYERAYGGIDARSSPERPFHYPRNPLGCGVALRNLPEAVEGLPLPNIEDPEDRLTPERLILGEEARWNGQPLPQGFGWFQKTWYPRCSFVGAMPGHVDARTVMREEGLGLVPPGQIGLARRFQLPSFDLRFNNGASLGLVLTDLGPGTRIRLARLTPQPFLTFALPDDWPQIGLDIGQGVRGLEVALHTVLIDVGARCAHLVWRGAQAYPGASWLPLMQRLQAEVL